MCLCLLKDGHDQADGDGAVEAAVEVVTEAADPLEKEAKQEATKMGDHIHRFRSLTDLTDKLPTYILPSHRVIFLLDSPTSRFKILAEQIEKVVVMAKDMAQFSIAVMCGARLDFCSAVQSKLGQAFPKSQSFITLITGGNDSQTSRRKAKFALVLHYSEKGKDPSVPTVIPALRGKARAFEGLRQRCLSLDCPLRSAEDKQKAEELKLAGGQVCRSEIPADDDECMPDDDEAMEEVEDDTMDVDTSFLTDKRDYIVVLFVFSSSLQFYEPILFQLLNSSSSSVCVIITSTAHPSSAVAARQLNQEVFLALPACSPHSIEHGIQLQHQIFRNLFLAQKGLRCACLSCMFFC